MLLLCGIAASESHYVALNSQGSGNGSDPANARALTWLDTSSNWGTGAGKVSPGDTVHLCGTFSVPAGTTVVTVHGSGTQGNEITILFEEDAVMTAPFFGGTETMNGGAINANCRDYIIIDGGTNGLIESTQNGSPGSFPYTESNIGVHFIRCNHCEVKNLTINNIYQATNNEVPVSTSSMGVSICGGNDIRANNNCISYVGHGCRISMMDTSGIYVYNNTIVRAGAAVFCGISNDGLSGDNVQIYNNRIFDTSDWGYNDGIKFFGRSKTKDPFTGIKVYNNHIGPNISHPGHPATAWILIDQGWMVEPEVYNNLLIGDSQDNVGNGYITVGGNGHASGFTLIQNSKIYNNTIVSAYPNSDICILLNKWATGHRIYNNVAHFEGPLYSIYMNDAQVDIADSNNNCWYSDTSVAFYDNGNSTSYSLSAWQSATGFDLLSINSDPSLDALYKPSTSSSPIVDIAKALGQGYVAFDMEGVGRPWGSDWDIGAYEYSTDPPDGLTLDY